MSALTLGIRAARGAARLVLDVVEFAAYVRWQLEALSSFDAEDLEAYMREQLEELQGET